MDPTDSYEKSHDRPTGRFFYNFSQKFYNDHADLLPQGYGVVCQEYEPVRVTSHPGTYDDWVELIISEPNPVPKPHETVLFDARKRGEGIYSWQYILATPNDRVTIKHIEMNEHGIITTWGAEYLANGQLEEVSELDDGYVTSSWQRLEQLVASPQTESRITSLRKTQDDAKEDLEKFKASREVIIVARAEEVNEACEKPAKVVNRYTETKKIIKGILPEEVEIEFVHLKVKLRDDTNNKLSFFGQSPLKLSYKQELDKRERHLSMLGFTLINLRDKPN